MPQLDIATYTSQIFWLIICFFSMLFIMSKLIIPKIAQTIEQRKRKIDHNIREADNFKEQAEAALLKYQKALDKATDKANKSLQKTQEELRKLIEAKQEELSKSLNEKIAESEKKILQDKEAALKEIKSVSEDLSLSVLQKIGITNISAKDIENTINNLEVE